MLELKTWPKFCGQFRVSLATELGPHFHLLRTPCAFLFFPFSHSQSAIATQQTIYSWTFAEWDSKRKRARKGTDRTVQFCMRLGWVGCAWAAARSNHFLIYLPQSDGKFCNSSYFCCSRWCHAFRHALLCSALLLPCCFCAAVRNLRDEREAKAARKACDESKTRPGIKARRVARCACKELNFSLTLAGNTLGQQLGNNCQAILKCLFRQTHYARNPQTVAAYQRHFSF